MPQDNKNSLDLSQIDNNKLGSLLAVPNKNLTLYNIDNSQYDREFIIPQSGDPYEALGEFRANNQPGIDQLANGVLKGAGLATTTFADIFGGTIYGIGNMIIKGSQGDINSGGDLLNAFVNNPFSNSMQDINEKMESIFTNYRSKAEQEAGLLDQMFDMDKAANFWGDMFIKNIGFAGGAMAAGMVSGKLFSTLGRTFAQKKEVELFNKMTKSIAAGEAKSIDGAIKILQQAPELVETSASEIKSLLEQGARISRNWNRVNQIVSSTLAATGEARIEALSNGRQFYDSQKNQIDMEYLDPSTGQVIPGKEAEYQSKLDSLEKNVQGFRNAVFLWNTVLLTASNFMGYRDMFAKNYALNAKKLGKYIETPDKIVDNVAAKFIKPTIKTYGKEIALDSGREGMEEFLQGVVQKSAENYYTSKFKGIDANAIQSIGKGLENSFDQEGLTNFVLGAMTGVLMGGKRTYNEVRDNSLEAQERVNDINKAYQDYVNTLKQDPTATIINFQEMVNRSINLDAAQQQALLKGDKYNYEALKNEKFYNLASAYIKAGKAEDLESMLKEETSLSADDLKVKYSYPKDANDPSKGKEDFFKGWKDEEITSYIREQSNKNTRALYDLRDTYEDLESRYGKQIATVTKDDVKKEIEIKELLARHLYLGNTLDTRVNDLYNELNKLIVEDMSGIDLDTGDGFAITAHLHEVLNTKEPFSKEGYDKVIKNLDKALENSSDKLKTLELYEDFISLVNERIAHNKAWIMLTKNSFSDLLNNLYKLDNEAESKSEEEESKELSDDDKINIVKEKSRKAGYVSASGETYTGNFFSIGDTMYEVEPANISDIRRQLEEEKESELEGLDPVDDAEQIAEIKKKYEGKQLVDLVRGQVKDALVKNLTTNKYVTDKDNKPVTFGKAFILRNYNRINFIPKEKAIAAKMERRIAQANQRKLGALSAVLDSINKQIDNNIKQAKKLIVDKEKLTNSLKEKEELFNSLEDEENLEKVVKAIDSLNKKIKELEQSLEEINKATETLTKDKNSLTELYNEIVADMQKGLNFSIDELYQGLKENSSDIIAALGLEKIDKLWAKKLIEDLREIVDSTEQIDVVTSLLDDIKSNVISEIEALTKLVADLERMKSESIDFKNWIMYAKSKNVPEWFRNKWKLIKSDNLYKLLNDNKKLSRFKYLMSNYAKKNNVSLDEAFEQLREDGKQLELELNYQEKNNIDTHITITNQDLAALRETLNNIKALEQGNLNSNLEKFNTLNKYLTDIKLEYAKIINRSIRDNRNKLDPSQILSDKAESLAPVGELTDANHFDMNRNSLSNHVFYTTNKTVEGTFKNGRYDNTVDSEGYPILNSNEDAINWNTFLENNSDKIDNKTYTVKMLTFTSKDISEELKQTAYNRILQGMQKEAEQNNQAIPNEVPKDVLDNTIITALYDIKKNKIVTIESNKYIYTFFPSTTSQFRDGSFSKTNYQALLEYFNNNKKDGKQSINNQVDLFEGEDSKVIKTAYGELTLGALKETIINFARNKHIEFRKQVFEDISKGLDVFVKPVGVTNGVLLTKKSYKDEEGNWVSNVSPVAETLKAKRDIDTTTNEGLENVDLHIVNTTEFRIPGTSIVIPNAKLGAVLVYNKKTKEYFYANQRTLENNDIKTVLALLKIINKNSGKKLSTIKVSLPEGKYITYKNNKYTQIPIFNIAGELALINNLIFWGGSKKADSKNVAYVQGNKVFFANPNNNWAITSLELKLVDDIKYNKDFLAYLNTKRININSKLLNSKAPYYHPYTKADGSIGFSSFKNYKDFLLNGGKSNKPVITTTAVSDNKKNNKSKLLFASKNIILNNSDKGKPVIFNSLTAEPETPEPSKPTSSTVTVKTVTTSNADFSVSNVVITDNNAIQDITINFTSKEHPDSTYKFILDTKSYSLSVVKDDKVVAKDTEQAFNLFKLIFGVKLGTTALDSLATGGTIKQISNILSLENINNEVTEAPAWDNSSKEVVTVKEEISPQEVEKSREECATPTSQPRRGGAVINNNIDL